MPLISQIIMIIHYANDLGAQRFTTEESDSQALGIKEEESHRLENNVLVTQSNPVVALDMSRLGGNGQAGKIAAHLFTCPDAQVTSVYDGLPNTWRKFPNTWPASIDTLVHLLGQKESGALEHANTVLDLGCGTGFAGDYACFKNPKLRTITYSDIEPNSPKTVMENHKNMLNDNPRYNPCFETIHGDTFEGLKDKKYDIIIASAVPATPVYSGVTRPINPLFEGTEFLETILKEAPEHLNKGGKLILSHSNLGENAFVEAANKYGAKIDRVLATRCVAFRTEFLGDQKWVDYLVAENGMKHKEVPGSTFAYWHSPIVKEISY